MVDAAERTHVSRRFGRRASMAHLRGKSYRPITSRIPRSRARGPVVRSHQAEAPVCECGAKDQVSRAGASNVRTGRGVMGHVRRAGVLFSLAVCAAVVFAGVGCSKPEPGAPAEGDSARRQGGRHAARRRRPGVPAVRRDGQRAAGRTRHRRVFCRATSRLVTSSKSAIAITPQNEPISAPLWAMTPQSTCSCMTALMGSHN